MNVSQDCKDQVKYLGILIDCNISWKVHSKIVGIIAKLRHFVPLYTLLNNYQSLISPNLTYELSVWGQAYKCYMHLNKILILRKRLLRFIYFARKNAHIIPLFTNAKCLPLNFLYYLSNRGLFFMFIQPHLNTRGVGRIRDTDSYANPRQCLGFASLSRILPTPECIAEAGCKCEKKGLYCFYKTFLKINSTNEGLLTS